MSMSWVSPSSAGALVLAVGLLLAIGLLTSLQSLASWWLQTYTGEKLVWDFRAQLLEHTQHLSLSFHDDRGATDPAYRIQHDAPSIQYIVIQGILPAFVSFCTLVGMLAVCATIDLRLALIALVITPVLFLLTRACSRLVRERSIKVKEIDSSAMSIIQEALNWGTPLVFYWAVYDNTSSGYWLIDATNTPQPLYYSFQEHYKTN